MFGHGKKPTNNELNLTASLCQIIDQTPELKDIIYPQILGQLTLYKKIGNPIKIIKQAYRSIDTSMKETIKGASKKPACTRGCTECCYMPVCISREEAISLKKYLRKSNISIDEEKLKYLASIGEDDYYKTTKIPCLFLKGSICSIYDNRPASCRIHLVVGDPKQCDVSLDLTDKEGKIQRLMSIQAEIVVSALMNLSYTELLPVELLKIK